MAKKTMKFYATANKNEFHNKNLKIKKPKKDRCKTCITFENNVDATELVKQSHANHIHKKNAAYKVKNNIKKMAKEDPKILACTFDLEALWYTTCSKVSTLFYKRKLCTYNVTMFNLASKEGYCLLWDETVAKRGSNEIGSASMKYIKKHPDVEHVFLISDACGGQTQNRFTSTLYLYLVQVLPKVKSINHVWYPATHIWKSIQCMQG